MLVNPSKQKPFEFYTGEQSLLVNEPSWSQYITDDSDLETVYAAFNKAAEALTHRLGQQPSGQYYTEAMEALRRLIAEAHHHYQTQNLAALRDALYQIVHEYWDE